VRTCTMHIGTPKAGSTTIQGFLRIRAKALADLGVDVPTLGEPHSTRAGWVLASALGKERDPAAPSTEPWRRLDAHLKQSTGDLVLSCEMFCPHLVHPARAAFAAGFFRLRNIRLRIVMYVRDSPSYLNSFYTQRAKKLRMPKSFAEWAEDALGGGGDEHSYWRMVRNLLDVEGVEVIARPLDGLPAGGLIPDFAGLVGHPGLDASDDEMRPFRNATPGPRAIDVSSRVARVLEAKGVVPRENRPLIRVFRSELAAQGWRETPFFGPDAALAARITERFRADNETFAERLWGTPWTLQVPANSKPQNVFDPAQAAEAEAADMDAFVKSFLARHVTPSRWLRLARRSRPLRRWLRQRASSFNPARIKASVGAVSPALLNAAAMAALACGAA
jgi:hypothetical protein